MEMLCQQVRELSSWSIKAGSVKYANSKVKGQPIGLYFYSSAITSFVFFFNAEAANILLTMYTDSVWEL